MATNSSILDQVSSYVRALLSENLGPHICYHNLNHTEEVVKAAQLIAINEKINEDEQEIIQIAAWFHDLGHTQDPQNHEEAGMILAEDFLSRIGYSTANIQIIKGCIAATKMPQNPTNKLQEIICDADLFHLSKDEFEAWSMLLSKEWEETKKETLTNKKWLEINKTFLESHTYFTDYAKKYLTVGKAKNLANILEKQEKKKGKSADLKKKIKTLEEKLAKAKAKENVPTRGIETMFRTTSKNHLDLSAMADNKANIMISINSIVLSIIISVLIRKLEEYPHFMIPTLIMTVVCLVTIVLSILATRPSISKGKFTKNDIMSNRTNLLFFGNFHGMSLEEYEWGMKELMKNSDYLYGSLIKDIYYLGAVLGVKYRRLRVAYTVFMFGFVIAVSSFIIAEIFFKSEYMY